MHNTQQANYTVPEGWRLVPVEPTEAMNRAAVIYANGNAVYKNVAAEALKIEESIYGEVWSAMLAAAPQPPAAQQGEAVAWSHEWDTDDGVVREVTDHPRHGGLVPPDRSRPLIYGDAQPAAAPQPVVQGGDITPARAEFIAAWNDLPDKLRPHPGLKRLHRAGLALAAAPAGVVGEPVEMSPEFTDTPRAALLWVLWHHQGGRSPVGQPIRYALGMGAHDPLSDHQVAEAKRWAAITKSTTAEFHTAPPARQALTKAEVDAIVYASREAEEGPTAMVQRIERACAEAWGVTLVGIGGKGGANG